MIARSLGQGLRRYWAGLLGELAVLNLAVAAGFLLRYEGHLPDDWVARWLVATALISIVYLIATAFIRQYRCVWRHATAVDVFQLVAAVVLTCFAAAVGELIYAPDDRPVPFSVLVIAATVGSLALISIKLSSQVRALGSTRRRARRLVVYGAGSAGIALVRQLQEETGELRPIAFVDDNPRMRNRSVRGLMVDGDGRDLARVVAAHRADSVAIAIPSAPAPTVRRLASRADATGARVLVVPPLHELLASPGGLTLREVAIEELCGRQEVELDDSVLRATFADRRVLVTGAAGTIGSETVRQLARLGCAELLAVDNNESGLTDLRDELEPVFPIDPLVVDITDVHSVSRTFTNAQPHIVVHAAALKHVDMLERQPDQAVRVNVLGTWICAQAAEAAGVERFVFISSDKAVEPVGMLGASKRIGERIVASCAGWNTAFSSVRFGNVLNSRGSVVPRFERQIARGGPITVTHPEIRRFFMSISEAVRLVLHSAALQRGGRLYLLNMGEEIRIVDLAHRLARLRGLRIPTDIELVFTGLRPGERLREQLVAARERAVPTAHPQIAEIGSDGPPALDDCEGAVRELAAVAEHADARQTAECVMRVARTGRAAGLATVEMEGRQVSRTAPPAGETSLTG